MYSANGQRSATLNNLYFYSQTSQHLKKLTFIEQLSALAEANG